MNHNRLAEQATEIIEHALSSQGQPDDLLVTKTVAIATGYSTQFFEAGRSTGNYGPKHIKISHKRVFYRRGDVIEWLKRKLDNELSKYDSKNTEPTLRAALNGYLSSKEDLIIYTKMRQRIERHLSPLLDTSLLDISQETILEQYKFIIDTIKEEHPGLNGIATAKAAMSELRTIWNFARQNNQTIPKHPIMSEITLDVPRSKRKRERRIKISKKDLIFLQAAKEMKLIPRGNKHGMFKD